jgi:hypothetical protein
MDHFVGIAVGMRLRLGLTWVSIGQPVWPSDGSRCSRWQPQRSVVPQWLHCLSVVLMQQLKAEGMRACAGLISCRHTPHANASSSLLFGPNMARGTMVDVLLLPWPAASSDDDSLAHTSDYCVTVYTYLFGWVSGCSHCSAGGVESCQEYGVWWCGVGCWATVVYGQGLGY